jgi:hypothetical protein
MGLKYRDWNEIDRKVGKSIDQRGSTFVQGEVIGVDPGRQVVFLKEFGTVPIPIFSFRYLVTIDGTDYPIMVQMPLVGDTVLVAQYFGSSELPKCLGVLLSTDFLFLGDD